MAPAPPTMVAGDATVGCRTGWITPADFATKFLKTVEDFRGRAGQVR